MKLLLLGHRGARSDREVPENTMASFDLCLQHGCDGFEFDLRKSLDGEVVICHDAKSQGRTISNTRALQLGLPTLAGVLRRYSSRAFLDVELKVPGLEELVLSLIQANMPTKGYVISSFIPGILKSVALLNSRAPLGIICGNRSQLSSWRDLPVEYVIVEKALVNQKLVKEIHSDGKRVMVWTVNPAPSMLRFAKFGIDGIISDQTARLVTTLRNLE